MEQDRRIRALKAAIQEGIRSGVSDRTVPDIMEAVEARLRATNDSLAKHYVGKQSVGDDDVDSKD